MKQLKFKIGIILLISLFIILFPTVPCLVLGDGGKVIYGIALKNKESFQIKYTHSVNKSDVFDTVARNNRNLLITKSQFSSFGAGIPNYPETPTSTMEIKDDFITISNINYELPQINLFVGATANHTIIVRKKEYVLSQRFEKGTLVTFKIRNLSLLELLILM